MAKKIKIVCSECGSDDVRRDAYASWDVGGQDWVVCEVYDDGFCVNCQGDAQLEEVGIEEIAAA